MQKYDYIIIGAGCSGLSLVHYMLKYEQLRQKKILLIDKNIKKENDRTWCFWEAQKGEFESLICKKWDYLLFQSQYFKKTLEINPYQYKMLQAIDFYHFIQQEIAEFPNISFVQANFEEIQEVNNVVSVKTDKGTFYAEKIFNSASNFNIYNQETKSIIQHFKGWVIQTSENYFNENEATFMDFAIPQESETRFVYVLPTQKNTALIEYTVFSNEIITSDEYDKSLKYYINNHLKIENYTILHTEMGAIPMSNYAYHQHQSENIINIGTAGGQVKPSTGFAFQRIQKKMKLIAEQLANDKK